MSFAKLEEITCPCGESFEAELWNSIDVSQHSELKEALLCGEINVVCCPACHQIFYAEHFILYHDHESEILAFVQPKDFLKQKEHFDKKMMEDFANAQQHYSEDEKLIYKPILLFGLDELVELVKANDEEIDETTIAEYIAKDNDLDVVKLHPCLCRSSSLPRVIPKKKGKKEIEKDDVLSAVEKIIKVNPNLEIYIKLKENLKKHDKWVLDEKYIKKSRKH